MNKRLVVLLGNDPASAAALRMGLRRAAFFQGVLVGAAVIDVAEIEAAIGGAPAGAIHYAEKARETKLVETQRQAEQLADSFAAACRAEAVRHEVYIKSGDPSAELGEELRTADLLLLGLQPGGAGRRNPETLLRDLLRAPLCPVIAVPAAAELPERVIVAYDGSPQAARALKAFARLSSGLPFVREVVLLHVGEDSEAGMALLAKADDYLQLYGFRVRKTVRAGDPRQVIFHEATQLPRSGVVIGAYGHGGLSELLFGSTARTLVRDGTVPLFLYH